MFKSNLNRGQSQNQKPKESGSGPLKLPRLWNAPAIEDLNSILAQAKKRDGFDVELPFSVSGQNSLYLIKVSCPPEGDPLWTFYIGSLTSTEVKWTLPSIDVLLVHNLVLSECTGQDSVDLISDHSQQPSYQRSSTGNFSIPEAPESQAVSQSMQGITDYTRNLGPKDPNRSDNQQAALEGDLEKLALPAVLQSLHLGKKSGRFTLGGTESGAEIYMEDGQPTHAICGEFNGDNAIIDVLTWVSGKFKFYENEVSPDKTVTKRLDSLIIESMGFLDQSNYLKNIGLTMDTFLRQVYPNLSETQFEQLAGRGTGYNMQLQKDFYVEIDNQTNLFDLLRRMPLTKLEWVPVLYNLLQVGLVQLALQASTQTPSEASIEPAYQIDEAAIQNALKTLMRPETEVYSYPVLQFFVKQELGRFERDGKAFSLIIFDLMSDNGGNLEIVPSGIAKALLHRVKGVKREIDILGHFETFDFGILLPQTSSKSAIVVAQRILERMKASPIPGMETANLSMAFGIAAIPQDCKTAGGLLSVASEAKKYARRNNLPIVEFKSCEGKT